MSQEHDNICSVCLEEYTDEKENIKIGCGHKFHADCISRWFENNSSCPVCRSVIDNKNNVVNLDDAFELYDWIQHMRDRCLTIADIVNLNEGDTVKLLCLDRNVSDIHYDGGKLSYGKPADFFKHNYIITYKHEKNLKGKIMYIGIDEDFDDFEFDIEYRPKCWYPLNNGRLPESDPQGFAAIDETTIKKWEDYPTTTLIGWRGPMIKWDIVKDENTPSVYYK